MYIVVLLDLSYLVIAAIKFSLLYILYSPSLTKKFHDPGNNLGKK